MVKTIQKYATENEIPMFVFHGFKIDPPKWELVKSIVHYELLRGESWEEIEKLMEKEKYLDKGKPKEIEIDMVTVDPINGFIVCEVESKESDDEASTSDKNKRLKSAVKEMKTDVALFSWLFKSFGLEKISTSIKKVAILPNDKITDEDDRRFGQAETILVVLCSKDFWKR